MLTGFTCLFIMKLLSTTFTLLMLVLDFSQSGDTPGDGNCMMLCLVDQMSYSEGLRDFAESAKDLRWKSAKDLDLVSFLH